MPIPTQIEVTALSLETSTDFNTAHRPVSGQPFVSYTAAHLMLDAKLSPCASLLYKWVLLKAPAGTEIKVDLQDFKAWSGEHRKKPYSDRQIGYALAQLKEFELVIVSKTQVTMRVRHPGQTVPLQKTANSVQKTALNPQKTAPLSQKIAVKKPKNTAGKGFQTSPDLITDQLQRQQQPTAHPVVVGEGKGESGSAKQGDFSASHQQGRSDSEGQSSMDATNTLEGDFSGAESDRIFDEIIALGIPLTRGLTALVISRDQTTVNNALAVVKERVASGRAKNPAGLLVEAIKGEWKPSTAETASASSRFTEWFNAAYAAGLVTASMKEAGEQLVLTKDGLWERWECYAEIMGLAAD